MCVRETGHVCLILFTCVCDWPDLSRVLMIGYVCVIGHMCL